MRRAVAAIMGVGLLVACDDGRRAERDLGADALVVVSPWRDAGASGPTPGQFADGHIPTDAAAEEGLQTDGGSADVRSIDGASPEVTVPSGPLVIYLAPSGLDARDGLSPQSAILTLRRAQSVLEALKPERDVEIQIAAGTYYGQTVIWTYTTPSHHVRLMPFGGGKTRPIFDGCLEDKPTDVVAGCPGGTWFTLRHANGEHTNLRFDYIHVTRYQTAISLDGLRNAEATSNGGNTIYGCYFSDIGNRYQPGLASSTAALRLVSSDDNLISNTHFVDIINAGNTATTGRCGRLHAIYVAHLSDRNRILRNRFARGCGDPIRLRDFSNNNVISENTFIQIGATAACTDWYCDHDVPNNPCTKIGPECPSWNNEFRDNILDKDWNCEPLGVFHYFQGETTSGCAPPSAGAGRLFTSGNTQASTPCSPAQ
ncbi:MAG: right-handed parallel beta-helix repeat-containing protein [Proteobacteria bacterium]|nr:right-handed parallel beta-helix repeat-containing protein [Pseudomonadota bacterium]